MTVWVGVDPGGRSTGIVTRNGDLLVAATVVTRDGPPSSTLSDWTAGAWQAYLADVLEAVEDVGDRYTTPASVAVEGVNNPGGRSHGVIAPIRPIDLAGLGVVIGALAVRWPDLVVVPPGGHGSGPLAVYPPPLVGPNESAGKGRLRHARSAWDIAGAAAQAAALTARRSAVHLPPAPVR